MNRTNIITHLFDAAGHMYMFVRKLVRMARSILPNYLRRCTYVNTFTNEVIHFGPMLLMQYRLWSVPPYLLGLNIPTALEFCMHSMCLDTRITPLSEHPSRVPRHYEEFFFLEIWCKYSQKTDYVAVERSLLESTLFQSKNILRDVLNLKTISTNNVFAIQVNDKAPAYPIHKYSCSFGVPCNVTGKAVYLYDCHLKNSSICNDDIEVKLFDYDLNATTICGNSVLVRHDHDHDEYDFSDEESYSSSNEEEYVHLD